MPVKSEWVRYGAGEQRSGLICQPDHAATSLPSILVLQEAWGVDAHIEDLARRFAAAGYVTLAPDLFSVAGKRPAVITNERLAEAARFVRASPPAVWRDATAREIELAKWPEEERNRIAATFAAMLDPAGPIFDLEQHVSGLREAVSFLGDTHPRSRGRKVGSVGFCMGGSLSGRLAGLGGEISAAVVFYGRSPSLEIVSKVECPVLGFYGAEDKAVTDTVPAFADAMRAGGKRFTAHVYPGAKHAFFNDTLDAYDVDASRDAFARTLDFFRHQLTD